ncbi:hypothetical protein CCAX7_17350 [Capsulimonas corticalis]|uniref:Uncharacterized protein n=2 Tax=Capsulimonas corticalis TaxID=2219043 RepID=A0A402D3Z0_9BACT|nr:hypothetical protein CCAX7_17350 [Capsulimonas corticalis]
MGAAALLHSASYGAGKADAAKNGKIDRKALVDRHKIALARPDAMTPLTVGNGEFAFTADITGLQTFPDFHGNGMLLQTMAQWAWHTTPDDHRYHLSDTFNPYDSHGRSVPYPSGDENGGGFGDGGPAAQWLNSNPHKFDLGRIGLLLPSIDQRAVTIDDITEIVQELDLWSGLLSSRFRLAGQPVLVETAAHPTLDVVAARITSPLVREGALGARLQFSYAPPDWMHPSDWGQPDRHTTTVSVAKDEYRFARRLDGVTQYSARAAVSPGSDHRQISTHEHTWTAKGQPSLDLVIAFGPEAMEKTHGSVPSFDQVRQDAMRHWKTFWSTGGAIDLSESRDSRWKELERRIVLSQYQTAVNSAGSLPPQETGLVQNSWYGKFHHEMHWWHAAHFPQWGREALLMRSLDYYRRILPVARETAQRIGCRGARWPKMVGPEGRESPNRINPFLTWQQPHPIHFAELIYQAKPTEETLQFFKEIVLESAEFMASFPWWNAERGCYELGAPIVAPYENNYNDRRASKNPTFDLTYWSWALGVAQQWRERLGMARSQEWDHVRQNFAPLTVRDGVYREIEQIDAGIGGHPTMLGALGVVPHTPLVDRPTMQRTLDFVLTKWPRGETWGWDYPMMAMTAARLGRPDQAIEALFIDTPKNVYLANGHNYQQSILPLYLPGNGGLLFATAMMAAGWKGAPPGHAPGFPTEDQGWTVRWEGLRPAL